MDDETCMICIFEFRCAHGPKGVIVDTQLESVSVAEAMAEALLKNQEKGGTVYS